MAEVICLVPVAPLRAEGSHRAEMVSQLLFGETALVLNETKDFYHIQMHQDGYEGWCQKLQLQKECKDGLIVGEQRRPMQKVKTMILIMEWLCLRKQRVSLLAM